MLNSIKKTFASESSFNFDDPRFKFVSCNASRFLTNFKTVAAPVIKSNEEKKGLLCNFSHLAANVGRYIEETPDRKAPFESVNKQQGSCLAVLQQDMGLVAG